MSQSPTVSLAWWSHHQSDDNILKDFLQADPSFNSTETNAIDVELEAFVEQLIQRKHRYKSEIAYLNYVYFRVHRKYLDHYSTPATMTSLFRDQVYDCLTGTALYALIFDRLGFKYQIVETAYHIYMTLYADGRSVLLESTNPIQGIVSDPHEINQMVNTYLEPENDPEAGKEYYRFDPIQNNISIQELAGLQFYNHAIQAYNQHQLVPALEQLEQALIRYPSSRVKEMMAVMLQTLSQSNLVDPALKEDYLHRYQHLLRQTILSAQAH